MFSESVPVGADDDRRPMLVFSPEKRGEIAHLEKSIQQQNKLISEQISRFFEQKKFYRSMEHPRHARPNLQERVKIAINYSYAHHGTVPKPKTLSFRQIKRARKSSKNISLALERDSMKKGQRPGGFGKDSEKPLKNLFKSGSSHPKIYSRQNVKISKHSEAGRSERQRENISDSLRKITANDFGTLGKEGNIIWVKDDSRKASKAKFHYVDQIRKEQLSTELFHNVQLDKARQRDETAKTMKKHAGLKRSVGNERVGERPEVKRSIKHKRRRSKSQKKHFVVSEIIRDKEPKSVVYSVKQNVKHKANSRSKSEITNKKIRDELKHMQYAKSKYKILRNLDKERKRSAHKSLRSDVLESNLRDESFHILKEDQLKLREIRRNYMKKWKEKRVIERNQSLSKKLRAKKPPRSKSIQTFSRAKVNQWAPFKTQAEPKGAVASESDNSSLGSLNKPPLILFKKNQMPKDSISLYKRRKKVKVKSVKSHAKEVKNILKKHKKNKFEGEVKKKQRRVRKKSKNQKRTYTNKFESTKKAFEYAKNKRLRKGSKKPTW